MNLRKYMDKANGSTCERAPLTLAVLFPLWPDAQRRGLVHVAGMLDVSLKLAPISALLGPLPLQMHYLRCIYAARGRGASMFLDSVSRKSGYVLSGFWRTKMFMPNSRRY